MKRRQRGEKWLLKVSLSLPIIMGYRCISESECRIPSYSIASQQNHQSWRHITVDNLTPYGNIWKQLIWLILILGSDRWSRPLILLTHDPWFWPLIPILDPESGFLTNDPCSREFSVFLGGTGTSTGKIWHGKKVPEPVPVKFGTSTGIVTGKILHQYRRIPGNFSFFGVVSENFGTEKKY